MKETKKRKKKKANIPQIENVEFEDDENGDESRTCGENNENSNSEAGYLKSRINIHESSHDVQESPRFQDAVSSFEQTNTDTQGLNMYKISERNDTKTSFVNKQSHSYKDSAPENAVKTLENRRVDSAPRLTINSETAYLGRNSDQNTSCNLSNQTVDESLVDLNSGVALTPVACPDEARLWALAESDDNESPGDYIGTGFAITQRLLGSSSRDSSASR